MKPPCLLFLLLPALAGAASTSLQFVPSPESQVDQRVVALPNGNVLVAGSVTSPVPNCIGPSSSVCSAVQGPLLAVLNPAGVDIGEVQLNLGSQGLVFNGAAADASGNIWLVGQTYSDDFPLVHPLYSTKIPYQPVGFVLKLDSGYNILFSSFLAGQQTSNVLAYSTPLAVTLDSAGNAYIVGSTADPNFPVTAGVIGTGAPADDGIFPTAYGFITEIAADGSQVIYSRLVGGNQISCTGTQCTEQRANTSASAVAVDAEGNVTVGGTTNALNFPVSAGAYQNSCCESLATTGFLFRLSSNGLTLIWSTFLGSEVTISSIALDSAGDVYATGASYDAAFPVTAGVIQSTVPVGTDAFAAKVGSSGSTLLYGTNLGGLSGATVSGLALDGGGNVWITGSTSSPDFPGLGYLAGGSVSFALELNSDASAVENFYALLPGTVTQAPAFDTSGNLLLLSSAGSLLRLGVGNTSSAPALFGLTNAAYLQAAAGVAPGEIATLFGANLGPAIGVSGAPDANGLFPTSLGGVSIQFTVDEGTLLNAPILYAGPDQINFQVPFGFVGEGAMTVTTPTATLPAVQMPQVASVGIFRLYGSDYAAALNQDQTVNSASNPAAEGSIVTLYATGIGADPSSTSGAVASTAVTLGSGYQIEVTYEGVPLPVLYAGTAPGLINGLQQINVQLPASVQNPLLTVYELGLANGASAYVLNGASDTVQVYAQ